MVLGHIGQASTNVRAFAKLIGSKIGQRTWRLAGAPSLALATTSSGRRRRCNGCVGSLVLRRLEAVLVLFFELCQTLLDMPLNVLVRLLTRPLCVPDVESIVSELMSSPVAPSSPLSLFVSFEIFGALLFVSLYRSLELPSLFSFVSFSLCVLFFSSLVFFRCES